MIGKTCCVTGHRDIPADQIAYVKQALRHEIELRLLYQQHGWAGRGNPLRRQAAAFGKRKRDEKITGCLRQNQSYQQSICPRCVS